MDSAVADKFLSEFGLTDNQIEKYESLFTNVILPVIDRHYLSHLVTTIEELINEKRKQDFLSYIKDVLTQKGVGLDYEQLEKNINNKILRLFSIILVPVESGKLKARTYFIRGEYGVLITYWKDLPKDQVRILIAHELGHVVAKYLSGNKNSTSDNGLATLFAYIAIKDRSDFYKCKTEPFIREYDMQIFHDIASICNRKGM